MTCTIYILAPAQGDLYWPIIKSSMYAIAGEKVKGEQILGEILPKIRQQLVHCIVDI